MLKTIKMEGSNQSINLYYTLFTFIFSEHFNIVNNFSLLGLQFNSTLDLQGISAPGTPTWRKASEGELMDCCPSVTISCWPPGFCLWVLVCHFQFELVQRFWGLFSIFQYLKKKILAFSVFFNCSVILSNLKCLNIFFSSSGKRD